MLLLSIAVALTLAPFLWTVGSLLEVAAATLIDEVRNQRRISRHRQLMRLRSVQR